MAILVTGATGGIGRALALARARLGDRIVAIGRDPEKLRALERELDRVRSGPPPLLLEADLGDPAQLYGAARRALAEAPTLEGVVHCAGLLTAARRLGPDGHELQLAVNALAPARLTAALAPGLRPGTPIVTVASTAHRFGRFDFDDIGLERGWSTMGAYRRSKLAVVAWSLELARRTPLQSVALHPGLVRTGMGAKDAPWWVRLAWRAMRPIQISPERASEHVEALLVRAPDLSGAYFERDRRATPSERARDPAFRERLWAWLQDA